MSKFEYPKLNRSDIVTILADAHIVAISDRDLVNPHPDFVADLYTRIIVSLDFFHEEDYGQVEFSALEQLENPDFHMDSVRTMKLYNRIKEVVALVDCPKRFTLKDMIKPETDRTEYFVSALLNFSLHRETKMNILTRVVDQLTDIDEQRKGWEDKISQLNAEIADYNEAREKELSLVQEVDAKVKELHQTVSGLNNQQKSLRTSRQKLKEKIGEIEEKEGQARAKEILDTVINTYIKTMTEDDDKEVVAQACMSLADIIKDYGYMVVEPLSDVPQVVDATLVLLREESACQQTESDDEIDDDDVVHDEELMDAVSDLLPAFAKSMGPHFAPIFAMLFEPLMKFARASRPLQDRTMVRLAEVAQDMGAPISGYVDRVMPLVIKELASSHATNRRNAAFCVGEFCKNGGEGTLKYYGDILRGLYPLFGESEPDDAVRDNAAGAVARMIMVHPESIPLNQVLPVFLKALPLKEDREESMAVYSCVGTLVLSSNAQILSLVPELINVFAQVVTSPVETPEVKAQIGRAFSHLISLYGHQMQPLLSNLSPAYANALAAFVPKS